MLNKISSFVDNWSENIAKKRVSNFKVGIGKEDNEKCKYCPYGSKDCIRAINEIKEDHSDIYTQIKADLINVKRIVGAIHDRRKKERKVDIEKRRLI